MHIVRPQHLSRSRLSCCVPVSSTISVSLPTLPTYLAFLCLTSHQGFAKCRTTGLKTDKTKKSCAHEKRQAVTVGCKKIRVSGIDSSKYAHLNQDYVLEGFAGTCCSCSCAVRCGAVLCCAVLCCAVLPALYIHRHVLQRHVPHFCLDESDAATRIAINADTQCTCATIARIPPPFIHQSCRPNALWCCISSIKVPTLRATSIHTLKACRVQPSTFTLTVFKTHLTLCQNRNT